MVALDDSINPKTGKKIFGCASFHDHAAKNGQSSYPWSQCILAIRLLKKVEFINFEWETLKDFSTVKRDGAIKYYRVGMVRGYIYGTEFDETVEEKKIEVYEIIRSRQSVKMLIAVVFFGDFWQQPF